MKTPLARSLQALLHLSLIVCAFLQTSIHASSLEDHIIPHQPHDVETPPSVCTYIATAIGILLVCDWKAFCLPQNTMKRLSRACFVLFPAPTTAAPSSAPSSTPSLAPSVSPSMAPSVSASMVPSMVSSNIPSLTVSPSAPPSASPNVGTFVLPIHETHAEIGIFLCDSHSRSNFILFRLISFLQNPTFSSTTRRTTKIQTPSK